MSEMFKKIKALFIVEEPTNETENIAEENTESEEISQNTDTPTPTQTVSYTQTYNTTSNISSNVSGTGQVEHKILDSLIAALEENNQAGFDFLEFKNAVKALQNLPMDDATKFRSAFATAATMGVTVDALLQSSEFYKSVLLKEKEAFEEELVNQMQLNVKSKEQELDIINQDILNKSELIKQLTQEIQLKQQQTTELKKSLIDAMDKIEITKKNFEASFDTVFKQLEDDVQKMTIYLKN